jgi:hypothetical protein
MSAIWKDYLVFGISRNQSARALSGFEYLHETEELRAKEDMCGVVKFDEFCKDPNSIAK